MKKKLLVSVLALALLSGCGGELYAPAGILGSKEPQSSSKLLGEPVALEQITPNGLVLRLMKLESQKAQASNVILSPLSIEMALGMAANGAAGEAAGAMETLLGMDAGQLNSLLGPYMAREDETLSIANSMWFQMDLKDWLNKDFLNTLSEVYGAQEGVFTPGSQAAADSINGWVKEKTRGKIDSIVSVDSLTEDTLGILINALYFNGKWAEPFEDWQVSEELFHAPGGDQKAQFMSQWLGTYFETEWGAGFAKDYEDGYEFIGLLPREEGPVDLSLLNIDELLATRTGAYDVEIKLPKFELEYATSLVDTLTELGLGSLFEGHSLDSMLNDGALSGGMEAHISDVIHKTYMKMYEEGTEAAAATGIVVECTSAAVLVEREKKQVYLDRPFAFLIRDTQSGQVVFCGIISSVEN